MQRGAELSRQPHDLRGLHDHGVEEVEFDTWVAVNLHEEPSHKLLASAGHLLHEIDVVVRTGVAL
eukprot:CAMPEP_0177412910 /NCGR_PEP_ID=MMETSP0368-20130122/66233_1 /TAXON_ID=447022 ORGANISM="Scrippsiella hangoei-like, Strain SHHI-4" /NCGR_SAMPLE_ID=MMETSP0368 /ASSEMBLY_ACC=CAM_ASM_000363 /LENGTH=64 /DNA_ID=CAMNT_0018882185 /DNA_START=9 /DNA_END=200 /DNA_ORIENTATION=-